MIPGITINNGIIVFNPYPKKQIGRLKYCKGFKIPTNQVKVIAFCPRLSLDEETFFILLIDRYGKIHPLPAMIQSRSLGELEEQFHLKSIVEEWQKMEFEDHYGTIEKIIYPPEFYWQDLFKRDFKFLIRRIMGGFIPKNFWGNFQKEVIGMLKHNGPWP